MAMAVSALHILHIRDKRRASISCAWCEVFRASNNAASKQHVGLRTFIYSALVLFTWCVWLIFHLFQTRTNRLANYGMPTSNDKTTQPIGSSFSNPRWQKDNIWGNTVIGNPLGTNRETPGSRGSLTAYLCHISEQHSGHAGAD